MNSHAYRLSECTSSRTAPGSSGTLPSRPPVEWGSELAGNPIHSRPRHPKNKSQIKIYNRGSRLPTPTPPDHTRLGKFLPKPAGLPEPRSPNYTRLCVRGPPFLHPPFLCRKTRETISYDQNYAELVEICPVSQLVSRAPAGVPLWPGATAGVLGPCGPGATAGVPAGLPPSLPALFVSRFAE